MSLLVVGSVAIDAVETPFGRRDESIGGSATYFSSSASYLSDVELVAVIGEDFPEEEVDYLKSRGIDTRGLEREEGKTFRWEGRYGYDLGDPETLETQLNVFGDFHPDLPEDYRDADTVFLANIDPELQLEVLDQVDDPDFVAADTMNLWIANKRGALEEVLSRVDMAIVNESEARQLADEANVVKAAQTIQDIGADHAVIKRGEYGALCFADDEISFAPAYPLENVQDPTGCGDTFAGGLLGFLDRREAYDRKTIRQATVMGSVMASFTVEDFSLDALRDLEEQSIQKRCDKFEQLVSYESLELLDE